MTSQNETSLPTTNFSGATSVSGILSWFYLKHMVFPVHVYKICHCFGIRKHNDCCSKSEAIFVDDQSHEIKAMHGACKTLQVSGMWNGGHFGSIWAPRKPTLFFVGMARSTHPVVSSSPTSMSSCGGLIFWLFDPSWRLHLERSPKNFAKSTWSKQNTA